MFSIFPLHKAKTLDNSKFSLNQRLTPFIEFNILWEYIKINDIFYG